jgi:hypothetical protein
MHPIPFPEQTVELKANPNQLEIAGQPVGTLPIFTDGEQCISCWSLSFTERLKALWYGKIWLGIHTGRRQPPVWLAAEGQLFERKG